MEPKVKFRVLYGFVNEFLNYLIEKEIHLTCIESTQFGFTAICSAKDYFTIARSSKKFQCRTKILKKTGLYFKLRKYLKRKGLIAGIILFPIWCFVFSKIIWRIDINTVDENLKNEIANTLFDNNVYTGTFYSKETMTSLKRHIMAGNNKIGYIAFNFYKGTLECEIYPAVIKEDYTRSKTEGNIYSQLDGLITDLRVYNGFSTVVLGQSVSKGDMLVCNTVTNEFNHTTVSKTRAYVEGICKKTYTVFIPFEKQADVYSGLQACEVYLYFMGKEYAVKKTETLPEKYTRQTVMKYGDFFGFHLPVTVKKITYYRLETKNISNDIISAQASAKMQLIQLTENDTKLKKEISREYDYKIEEKGIFAVCVVEGYYDMT